MSFPACRALGVLALSSLLAPLAAASDARALTDDGSVLTVSNWALVTLDGGELLRIGDDRVLGWELRDGDGALLGQGLVPGTESTGVDGSPALSRSPLSGEIWLAWSRQAAPGTAREITLERFSGSGWSPGSIVTIAADTDDQLEPTLVHDESGTAWMAWIDGAADRAVRFAGIAADGRLLGTRSLSENVSRLNGAPSLGIDATGQLFVAYAGTPEQGGDVNLFVLTPNPIGGGVSHLPNPIIELGLRATMPAPSIGVVPSPNGEAVPSKVNLTVLGGTPLAWWTEVQGGTATSFHYTAQDATGHWTLADARTLDLRSGGIATVPEALALVEARLRRVIQQAPGSGTVVSPPISVGDFGRMQIRR